jgi:hypothetical protein
MEIFVLASILIAAVATVDLPDQRVANKVRNDD